MRLQHVSLIGGGHLKKFLTNRRFGSTMEGIKSHARRDRLLEIESKVQKRWEQKKVFEIDAPSSSAKEGEKFFGNFPYPYMNGLLHLGHAFSASKLEFAAAYHRLRGRNGRKCSACADKIAREIKLYGNPPKFPAVEPETPIPTAPVESGEAKAEPEKFKSKKVVSLNLEGRFMVST
ncbi:hypothetical protein R1sor_020179 [Riccia sorocarpa]|uniref:leucine--tRNA ligase n=1 Tax=Riccia sorocarpa TaxID=122646 RepID=A0ABD3IHD8_9MARC